jgi:DNA-binding SARP family transcriptional activator
MSDLVDFMWEIEPPISAHNVIHKYVGTLRRLLEPSLPARCSGAHVLRRGNGYIFAGLGSLDLERFRRRMRDAEVALTEGRRDAALGCFVQALGLWHGPAGDGLDHGLASMPVFVALNDEFFDACIAATELAMALGQPQRLLPPLHLATSMAPLHEPLQACLVSTLAAAGQQAKALSVYSAVRRRLVEDLGVDPGRALEAAYLQVLTQTPATSRPPAVATTPIELSTPPPQAVPESETRSTDLVGRAVELAVLRRALEPAFAGGTAVVVIEGEPGIGKSRLLEEIAAEMGRRDALVVWGHCLEGDGTPSMWPWVQVVEAVLASLPTEERERWLSDELAPLVKPRGEDLTSRLVPDNNAQFRLFESIVAVFGELAAHRPVVVVIDDLQWADLGSLHVLRHVVAARPCGTVLLGALRDRAPAPGSELARTLAAASRAPGYRRIRLGPLDVTDVAELVRRETGEDPDCDTARSIHSRTAGNAFFVRELSRLLATVGELTENAAVRAGVPSTVLDVVRDRMATLDENTTRLLQIASLIGRDVEIAVLARAADLEIQACLDRLEPLDSLGLVGPASGDPFSLRFAHDLIRESICETTPPQRAGRLHLRIADALQRTSADDAVPERLAHHLWAAGPLADPARTAEALTRAGHDAATKTAFETAAGHLQAAAHVARSANRAELELAALAELTAVVGMQSMYSCSTPDLLERAEQLARSLDREVEATVFLYSRWAAHAQAVELDRSGPLARRLLEQGNASSEPIVRAYGLNAWGIHQWAIGNIGEAFRYLNRSNRTMLYDLARREDDPVGHDLMLLITGMLAETTALHGDVAQALVLLDALEAVEGDDPYAITVSACFGARIGSIVGDPALALRAAERGIAADPGFSFIFLGTYQRLARCWALAVTGRDPEGAAREAEGILAANLLDPPRSCVALWHGLIGEMWLAAGAPDKADAALDQADACLAAYGQRYPEGLLLLLRARVLRARGEPVVVVRAAADKARANSAEREAHLFAYRAEKFLAEFDEGS